MYKASRVCHAFRQLSQKCFINKNKLNLTDSLEGNFLIKLIVLTGKKKKSRGWKRKENRN